MNLTDEQEEAIYHIKSWLVNDTSRSFRLGGLAGTGKSWLAPRLPELLGLSLNNVVYIAPTNRAARVLQVRLLDAGVQANAQTLHSRFFTPRDNHCKLCTIYTTGNPREKCHVEGKVNPNCSCGLYFNPKTTEGGSLVVICDEASMVDSERYDDMLEMVPNARFIFIGDHGQLPPVGDKHNLMENPDFELKIQQRTGPDSIIPALAHRIRNGETLPYERFSEHVIKIPMDGEFEVPDLESTVAITYFRNPSQHGHSYVGLNKMWRNFLGRGERPEPGDRVLARRVKDRTLKGSLGSIKVITPSEFGTNYSFVEIDLLEEERSYLGHIANTQFNNPTLAREPKTFDLWDFGYSITAHSAQGTEFDSVVVYEPKKGFRNWVGKKEYMRWLYTAVTRSRQSLVILG